MGPSSASASRRGLAAVRSPARFPLAWSSLAGFAGSRPRPEGQGASRFPNVAPRCCVLVGGARCGLRPPVSPCRIRRCAVSRRGQLGPGVVSRRECVRVASARRGCRRAPTGGLPGSAPAVPRLPAPLAVVSVRRRWCRRSFPPAWFDRRRCRASLSASPPRQPPPPRAPRPGAGDVPALPMPRGVWGSCRGRVGREGQRGVSESCPRATTCACLPARSGGWPCRVRALADGVCRTPTGSVRPLALPVPRERPLGSLVSVSRLPLALPRSPSPPLSRSVPPRPARSGPTPDGLRSRFLPG